MNTRNFSPLVGVGGDKAAHGKPNEVSLYDLQFYLNKERSRFYDYSNTALTLSAALKSMACTLSNLNKNGFGSFTCIILGVDHEQDSVKMMKAFVAPKSRRIFFFMTKFL